MIFEFRKLIFPQPSHFVDLKLKQSPASPKKSPPSGIDLARLCLHFAEEKKAENPVLLDLRKLSGPADFFLIAGAWSVPQLKAMAHSIYRGLKESGITPGSIDGFPKSRWVVIDYGDVLVHLMHEDSRAFYRLEELWRDAVVVADV